MYKLCTVSLLHAACCLCYEVSLIWAGLWEAYFTWKKIISCLFISITYILKCKSIFSSCWNLVQNPGENSNPDPQDTYPASLRSATYLLYENLKAKAVLNITSSRCLFLLCSAALPYPLLSHSFWGQHALRSKHILPLSCALQVVCQLISSQVENPKNCYGCSRGTSCMSAMIEPIAVSH